MEFKNFTDADKLAEKTGWTKVTGRIFLKTDAEGVPKFYTCVIKIDGIIQAFTATLPRVTKK
jgi:hypothetical protein